MNSIEIWFESLNSCEYCYSNYWNTLDFKERTSAQRFNRELDRRRFVVSHGKLRQILASYLHLPPDEIVLATQFHGKPFVFGDIGNSVTFNMSHSDSYLLVGVGSDYEIGVDIEKWKDFIDYENVLSICFSDFERRFWRELTDDKKQEFFYRQWVRKESFVKAIGLGLYLDVSCVESSLTGVSQFLSLPASCGSPQNWRLIDLKLAHCLSGAITVSSSKVSTIIYKRLDCPGSCQVQVFV